MKYATFSSIDSETALARFFNRVMCKLGHLRTLCAPDSFHKQKDIASFQDAKFCDFCRYETWMHAVVERLSCWQETIGEYFNEFHGNWQYYAAYHRISAIKEWGAEKNDLDEDGNIRTAGLSDKEYMHYTIMTDLFDDGWKDIVQDTGPDDICGLCADIVANSRIDFLDGLRRFFGDGIKPYKQTKDGELRPVTQEEHELDMICSQVDADDDSMYLMAIAGGVQCVLAMFRTCKFNDNNTELLRMASKASGAMLDMDFMALDRVIKRFAKKYAKEDVKA